MKLHAKTLLTALIASTGAMFLLDREKGAARRAKLRRALDGAIAQTRRIHASLIDSEAAAAKGPIDDAVLVHRIRSAMGEVVRNAEAIAVASVDGVVTVNGPVLVDELPGLLRAIRSVPGVSMVQDELEVHEYPDQTDLARGEERLADRD
jgi:osmotically-inducible protein OsmY